ncbi:hypothetical protein BURCENK562V_C1265 [Burkholderia cenocepacia K56-2Valvano]|nr:hypothetical protein BURCENK562V_C1265 [Burkholderia cenocepacia K56-2Valvano]
MAGAGKARGVVIFIPEAERDADCGGTLEQAASRETTATGTQIRSMARRASAARSRIV